MKSLPKHTTHKHGQGGGGKHHEFDNPLQTGKPRGRVTSAARTVRIKRGQKFGRVWSPNSDEE